MRNWGEEKDINKKFRININNIDFKNSDFNKLAHQYTCK